jgi:hypothetical protein
MRYTVIVDYNTRDVSRGFLDFFAALSPHPARIERQSLTPLEPALPEARL